MLNSPAINQIFMKADKNTLIFLSPYSRVKASKSLKKHKDS